MGFSIRHTVLFLAVMSSAFSYLPCVEGGFSGSCAIGSSYDFLGDPSIDMNSFTRPELITNPLITNSSLNQTSNAYVIKNSFIVRPIINRDQEDTTSDNGTVVLGGASMRYKHMSTPAFMPLTLF